MSLRHALLGFLNYGPMTGYELKKVFDATIAHFWSAELSQIYPTLKRLESEGLVDMEVQVQDDRPNRKVYSITEDGRDELIDWLAMPAQSEAVRDPLLINVFFGASLPREELIGVLGRRRDKLRHAVEGHQPAAEHSRQLAKAVGLEREGFFWSLTIDAYLHRMKSEAAWLDDAIARIERADGALFDARAPAGAFDARKAVRIVEAHLPNPHVGRRRD
jgi:DNA-binding PadR family transcriptional regulator